MFQLFETFGGMYFGDIEIDSREPVNAEFRWRSRTNKSTGFQRPWSYRGKVAMIDDFDKITVARRTCAGTLCQQFAIPRWRVRPWALRSSHFVLRTSFFLFFFSSIDSDRRWGGNPASKYPPCSIAKRCRAPFSVQNPFRRSVATTFLFRLLLLLRSKSFRDQNV